MKRIKPKRKHSINTERQLVRRLLKEIEEHPTPIKAIVDSDSPGRVYKSGFDFLLTRGEQVLFIEAKRVKNITENPWELLTPFQQLTSTEVLEVGSQYLILLFQILKEEEEIFISLYEKRFDGLPFTHLDLESFKNTVDYLVGLFE